MWSTKRIKMQFMDWFTGKSNINHFPHHSRGISLYKSCQRHLERCCCLEAQYPGKFCEIDSGGNDTPWCFKSIAVIIPLTCMPKMNLPVYTTLREMQQRIPHTWWFTGAGSGRKLGKKWKKRGFVVVDPSKELLKRFQQGHLRWRL